MCHIDNGLASKFYYLSNGLYFNNPIYLTNNNIMLNRILVLDDNQDVLDIVEETLNYENFQVLVTSDSHNIIEIAKIFRPDLFILDYKVSGRQSEESRRDAHCARDG